MTASRTKRQAAPAPLGLTARERMLLAAGSPEAALALLDEFDAADAALRPGPAQGHRIDTGAFVRVVIGYAMVLLGLLALPGVIDSLIALRKHERQQLVECDRDARGGCRRTTV